MLNQGYIKLSLTSSDSFEIRSGFAGGGYFVDSVNTSLTATPIILPGQMDFVSPEITRISNTINADVSWTMFIKFSTNSFSQTDQLLLTIPDKIVCDNNQTKSAVLLISSSATAPTSKTTYSSGAINTIVISNVCGLSGYATDSILNITLLNFINPHLVVTVTETIKINFITSAGRVIDEATTTSVYLLFSSLEALPITSIDFQPDDPSSDANTNYDVIFSTDTDVLQISTLVVTFHDGVTISDTNTGGSTSLNICTNLFDFSVNLTCTVRTDSNGKTTNEIERFFLNTTNSGQFGVDIGILTNPSLTGETGSFGFEILTPDNYTVAQADSGDKTKVKTSIADSECSSTCETCFSTTTS